MSNEIIRTAVEALSKGRDPVQARIAIFEHVREIPYAYPASRDPVEVLKQQRGSCSGKHYLLAEMLRCLGLKVRHMIGTNNLNESPIAFPDQMQELLRKNEIVDLHDYLQIAVGDSWVDVDATWENALHDYGFPVNQDWDGKSPMLLNVGSEDSRVAEGDPEKIKEEMLSHMTPRQRSLRKQFLEALNSWIQEIAAETRREAEN